MAVGPDRSGIDNEAVSHDAVLLRLAPRMGSEEIDRPLMPDAILERDDVDGEDRRGLARSECKWSEEGHETRVASETLRSAVFSSGIEVFLQAS